MDNQTFNQGEILEITNTVEPNLKKWNWGAAFLSIFWGVGNKSYLALLSLVPIVNLFWWIVCGIKGNKWAWESGIFKDVESFDAAQGTWNRAGIVSLIFTIIGFVIGLIFYTYLVFLLMEISSATLWY